MHGYDDVRLRLHLVLETGDGERLAEIQNSELIPDLIDPDAIRSSEARLQEWLERVLSPARGLIRGHIFRIRERRRFKRRDDVVDAAWPEDDAASQALDAKAAACFAETWKGK